MARSGSKFSIDKMHKYLNAKVNRSENFRPKHHTIDVSKAKRADEDLVNLGDVREVKDAKGATEDGQSVLKVLKKPRYPMSMNTVAMPSTKSKLAKKERKRVLGSTVAEKSDPNTVA